MRTRAVNFKKDIYTVSSAWCPFRWFNSLMGLEKKCKEIHVSRTFGY